MLNYLSTMTPHPLTALSEAEFKKARDIVTKLYGADTSLFFRAIFVQEPKKAELTPFLQAEHDGKITDKTPRPARQARLQYDVIKDGKPRHTDSVVDLDKGVEVERITAAPESQTGYTP